MVPAGSDRVSRARPYSGAPEARPRGFGYRAVTFCGVQFHALRLPRSFLTRRPAGRRITRSPPTPPRQRLPPLTSQRFGLVPFRSPLLRESRFLSFPLGTEMFQFPSLPHAPYGFRRAHHRITGGGLPHSEIPGSTVGQHLPRAYRSRPRPSSALGAKASTVCPSSLDREEHTCKLLWSFQGARGAGPPRRRPEAGLSKLSSEAPTAEVDVRLGEPGHRTAEAIDEPGSHRSHRSGIPRKEVIQPQLPLRLPCYDFTPITDPTFDGSLPCGLGHRLRVLPTFVV